MEKIRDMEQLNGLLEPFLKRRHISNDFTLPSAYHNLISEKRLFYIHNKNALFLLEDMDNYYRIYYHLYDMENGFRFAADKPVVAEVVFMEGKEPPEITSSYLERAGFNRKVERLRMAAGTEAFLPDGQEVETGAELETEDKCVRITPADINLLEEIKDLLNRSFDRITGFLPSACDLDKAVRAGEVFCALDACGEVRGVLHIGISDKTSNLLHIAVSKASRKQGIGKILLRAWKEAAGQAGVSKYLLWVTKENWGARSLYEKSGFRYDGRCALTFVHN